MKIMDFGISRWARPEPQPMTSTEQVTVRGTPYYMAPEQKRGEVRRESDVFSLGACLYEMVTGQRPLDARRRPCEIDPSLPAELDGLIDLALQPHPAQRVSSAGEFWTMLIALRKAPLTRSTRHENAWPSRCWAAAAHLLAAGSSTIWTIVHSQRSARSTGEVSARTANFRAGSTQTHGGKFQAPVRLSLALDHAAWGQAPALYHLENVLWHLLNGWLVFLLLSRMLDERSAFVGMLVFIVHPVQVETVAWVTQRPNLLCLAGFLGALLLLTCKKASRARQAAGLMIYGLSLFAKEQALVFPAALLISTGPNRRHFLGAGGGGLCGGLGRDRRYGVVRMARSSLVWRRPDPFETNLYLAFLSFALPRQACCAHEPEGHDYPPSTHGAASKRSGRPPCRRAHQRFRARLLCRMRRRSQSRRASLQIGAGQQSVRWDSFRGDQQPRRALSKRCATDQSDDLGAPSRRDAAAPSGGAV